jgi:hypothetical protein
VAGFYGNIGQSDYAMANEIFNKTAHLVKRAYPACHVVSINWGPWDGGMVTPALKQYFAERNIPVIPIEEGAQLLIRELEAPHISDAAAQVIIGGSLQAPPGTPDSTLRSYRIGRRLTLQANPFLLHHVIGDHAVLPAVCGIAWTINACEQLYPGYTFHRYRNYKVLKGIVFDESLADTYMLEVKELAKDQDEITFEVLVWSETPDNRKRFHYSGEVTLCQQAPEAPLYNPVDLTDNQIVTGEHLYETGMLFHGPFFRGIERVLNIDEHRLTMQCRAPVVPPEGQGQFPIQTFNPYHADVEIQCMVVWVRHYYDMACLPLRMGVAEQFRAIPPETPFYVTMEVLSSSESKLVTNVYAHDEQGRLYMRILEAEVTNSARLNSLFLKGRYRHGSKQELTVG